MRRASTTAIFAAAVALTSTLASAAPRCSFRGAVGVNFGSYDPLSQFPLDSLGSLTLQCDGVSPGTMVAIHLSPGSRASFATRGMRGRGGWLEYNLFQDASRSVVWGDGTGGSSAYMLHPTEGMPTTVNIFARAPARQHSMAGAFTDQIVVTILF